MICLPYIKVDVGKINQYVDVVEDARMRLQRIMYDFSSIGMTLDWDVKASYGVNSQIMSTAAQLNTEASSLSKMKTFLNLASVKYTATNTEIGVNARKLIESTGATFRAKTSVISSLVSKTGIAAVAASVGVKTTAEIVFDNPLEYVDLKDIISESKDVGSIIYELWKKGFWSSNFNVKQVGDYLHVYGKNKAWKVDGSTLEGIIGRRYRIGSDKDVKSGVSARATNVPLSTQFDRALKWQFKDFTKDTFFSKSSIIDYAFICYNAFKNAVGNVKNGASVSKIGADLITDVGTGLGGMAATSAGVRMGMALGTLIPIPVVGTLLGGIAGGAIAGFAYDYILEGIKIGGKSIAGWTSFALETAGDFIISGAEAVGDIVVGAGKAVGDFAQSAGRVIGGAVDAVGDAVSGVANGVKNFFGSIF